jgi:hypothetical protein
MTETVVGRLLSVNVGLPNDIAWRGGNGPYGGLEARRFGPAHREAAQSRIGDRYRIGSALFEGGTAAGDVLPRRHPDERAQDGGPSRRAHGRPGFYFRVIEEGEVEAGRSRQLGRSARASIPKRSGRLSARSARIPRRRQPAHLLLATAERRGRRSMSGSARVENA